ncbi:MAG: MoxR family ATPase [Bdellovibrionaceae bacterium]|nr:MoxR family ATPase [Pseudobdellovibrionaceae bacterium]
MLKNFPIEEFKKKASDVIVGKEYELQMALACLLARGHLLVEDVPGMGKTTFVILLSQLLDLPMKRVQFTNDMLPTDILGFQTLNDDKKTFHFHKGPIFSELVLADELNRGTPKTQSALLQAMEEKMVTVDGTTYPLPEPFFLIATQNPQEHSGTFPLPESQLDRFMMCMSLGYPTQNNEIEILRRGDARQKLSTISCVVKKQDFLEFQKQVDAVFASEATLSYVQSILQNTRGNSAYTSGLSSRCGILLIQAGKAWAFLQGRNFVLPEDIKIVAPHCLKHRLLPAHGRAKNTNTEFVQALLQNTSVPV